MAGAQDTRCDLKYRPWPQHSLKRYIANDQSSGAMTSLAAAHKVQLNRLPVSPAGDAPSTRRHCIAVHGGKAINRL
ncbi:MAG: hypothetical protein B7Z55_03135 [Planctomycetales bacterium 12-60-4]|nr:MAG: hypothetical protein B7Z55_03135 [Planctomycetales bacterium 12-60-4]